MWVRGNRESRESPGLSHVIVMITCLQHISYPSYFFLGEINFEPYSITQLLPSTSATTLPWMLTNCTYSVNFVTDFEILSLSSSSSDWPKTRLFPHSLFSWEEEFPSLSCPQPSYVCCLLAVVHTAYNWEMLVCCSDTCSKSLIPCFNICAFVWSAYLWFLIPRWHFLPYTCSIPF